MSPIVKALVRPDDPSLIPGSHMAEGENGLPQAVL